MNKNLKLGIGIGLLALALLAVVVYMNQAAGDGPAPATQEPLVPEQARTEPPAKPAKPDVPLKPTPAEELVAETAELSTELTAPEAIPYEAQPELPEETLSLPEGPFADSEALRSQETIKIDPPMREIGRDWMEDSEKRSNFTMPVTGGRDLEIEVERFEAIGEEGGEFIGKVKGVPGSTVRLSYRGQAEAGTIRLPSENRSYRILPGQSGEVVVQERNLAMDEPPVPMRPENMKIPPVPNFTPPPPPEGAVAPAPN